MFKSKNKIYNLKYKIIIEYIIIFYFIYKKNKNIKNNLKFINYINIKYKIIGL